MNTHIKDPAVGLAFAIHRASLRGDREALVDLMKGADVYETVEGMAIVGTVLLLTAAGGTDPRALLDRVQEFLASKESQE